MKKLIYKKIFLIIIFGILLINSSCNKKYVNVELKDEINVYEDSKITQEDILFDVEDENEVLNNNVLKIDFNLTITNNSKNNISLDIKNPILYGNDNILNEEVLQEFNKDDENLNKKYENTKIDINQNKSEELTFIVIIQDGNKDALYKIEFELNNIKINIYSYNEDYKPTKFVYVHNPLLYDKVLADAIYDENAVFGFKPSETGSLKAYASYDWTIETEVLNYKKERIDYVDSNDKLINELENNLKNENKTIEEIARACSSLRNKLRLDAYNDNPEGLAIVKQRNLEKYGHEEGPLADDLYEKYGSWEKVLEKCYSTNPGMDACCGVYDMYFYLYKK